MKKNRLLLLAILLLGVGFALVSTTLLMTGNIKIATNNADFDVIFTKAIIDGTDISSTAISEDGKTITFSTKDLSTVGDISKLDFEITNNSAMYDAEVNMEISANETNKDYYEITKEVPTTIAGKKTGTGKIEISLKKASVEDIQGTFTCTLTATAAERERKAKIPQIYYAFGDPTIESNRTTDYTTLKYPDGSPAKVFAGLDEINNDLLICILYNGRLECFNENRAEQIVRKQEVFGKEKCSLLSNDSIFRCDVNDFYCEFQSCRDKVSGHVCAIGYDGRENRNYLYCY